MKKQTIGVVYLCRANENKTLFSDFINSYKRFSSNCHELIIIFKGFQDNPTTYLNEIQKIFDGVPHRAVYLPDEGFDIGSYLATAKIVDHQYLLFFNTHTTIVADNWLMHLWKAITNEGVGLVGTTASYESIFSALSLTYRFSDLYIKGQSCLDPHIFDYYRWLVTTTNPNINSLKRLRRIIKFRIIHFLSIIFKKKDSKLDLNFFTNKVTQRELSQLFYNPYIRSNSFMISRKLLLDLFGDFKVRDKNDACKFECGPENLTRKVLELGLKTLLVDKNGNAYDIEDWPKSNTFRLGNQKKLLTNDNQTRKYQVASQEEKLIYTWVSWSNAIIYSKTGFSHLGLIFPITPLTQALVHKYRAMS